jgi:simple sugar transport system substrate-binding protein
MKSCRFGFFALVFLAACVPGKNGNDALSSATVAVPDAQEILVRCMPAAMADGLVKVAVICNQVLADHGRQFLAGCVSEGRSMGFTVDTFITAGDNDRCRRLLAAASEADYDGLIFSHGDADFTWEALGPAVERGLKIVTFEALPYSDGKRENGILPGVTSTAQDDEKLARISLEALFARIPRRPLRVIRVWAGPGIPPLDRRQLVYDEFIRDGAIEEAALVSPRDFTYSRSGVREAFAALSGTLSADAIWAPYDEFAKGCLDALGNSDAGIKMVSIDISNDDIALMLEHPGIWLGTAAMDPALAGLVNMRLLAAKFAGEETPETYSFGVHFVETADLDKHTNMANIALKTEGWGKERGIFDGYPWMAELKAAAGKYGVHGEP